MPSDHKHYLGIEVAKCKKLCTYAHMNNIATNVIGNIIDIISCRLSKTLESVVYFLNFII